MKKGFLLIFLVMVVSLVIASLWNTVPIIGKSVHAVLDPTFGYIMKINLNIGFIFVVFVIVFLTTLVQKYGSDQEALKTLKDEQKKIQEDMKKYKDDPAKMIEFQKKQFEQIPKTFEHSMTPLVYTAIPFVLLIRWFTDIFKNLGDPKILGFFGWIWAYLLLSIVFSTILRKVMKVY
ncbi:DUF106 domain-containing protein [Candidatus Woesearchaeota archaeon]|nr:DUF106 domain-containing protein [Candidatus Woesearchaeota archaeon]